MSIQAQSADGAIHEFPDGTPQEVITRAMKQYAFKGKLTPDKYDPTEGMSGMDKFLAGTGKAFVDMGRGVGQMTGLIDQASVDEAKRRDAPLMNTGAGMAGNIAGNVAAMIPAAMIPGANTLAGASLVGAVSGAIQPTATGESRAANAMFGGVTGLAGQGVANTIGRAVRPVRAELPTQASRLAGMAPGMGVKLNAAQQSGSKPLRWIDSALDNLPFTAERQGAMKGAQRDAWQRAVMGQVGETADDASPAVLGAAKNRIGQSFRDLSGRNTVKLDDDLTQMIAKVRTENAKAGPLASGKVDQVAQWLDSLSQPTPARSVPTGVLDAAGNPIMTTIPGRAAAPLEGKTYQEVRSILSKESKDAFNSQNSRLGQSLKELRNALDDAADRSISPADRSAWRQARQQYATLKTVEKAVDPTTGTISPKKLVNELTRANPSGMKYGQGDQTLPDITRFGKEFIAENLPDSGTAQRSWYMNMLQNPTAGIGGALGFMGGGVPGAALGAAAGAGTPLAVQRALWSQPGINYLTRGIQPALPAMPYLNVGAQAIPLGLLNSGE